jgi:hypothetical protein
MVRLIIQPDFLCLFHFKFPPIFSVLFFSDRFLREGLRLLTVALTHTHTLSLTLSLNLQSLSWTMSEENNTDSSLSVPVRVKTGA